MGVVGFYPQRRLNAVKEDYEETDMSSVEVMSVDEPCRAEDRARRSRVCAGKTQTGRGFKHLDPFR